MKADCTYKYNWKILKELFPSELWLILKYVETFTYALMI